MEQKVKSLQIVDIFGRKFEVVGQRARQRLAQFIRTTQIYPNEYKVYLTINPMSVLILRSHDKSFKQSCCQRREAISETYV